MNVSILNAVGYLLGRLPATCLRLLVHALGNLLYAMPSRRRYVLRSNLHHAFPEKSDAWRRRMGRESCRRTIEMGVFTLTLPFLGENRLRRALRIDPDNSARLRKLLSAKRPLIALVPHVASAEAVTIAPFILGGNFSRIGAIYRPFDHPALEEWIRMTRERHGTELFSRREGFRRAMETLRVNGSVAILFDQNAGKSGSLITFFGRPASSTDLPDMLARRFDAAVVVLYPRRTGFFEAELIVEPLTPRTPAPGGITLAAAEWLEALLRRDDNACASWLWLHERWKTQARPKKRFRLSQKRNLIDLQRKLQGKDALPRNTRFLVRLPDRLCEVLTAVPFLKSLRNSRPDAAITAIGKDESVAFLDTFRIVDQTRLRPSRVHDRIPFLLNLRNEFADTCILLNDSRRARIEARLTACPQRFGIAVPGHCGFTKLLTDACDIPPELANAPLFRIWEYFFRSFGLDRDPDFTPLEKPENDPAVQNDFPRPAPADNSRLALVWALDESSESAWPFDHWKELVSQLLDRPAPPELVLFGPDSGPGIAARLRRTFPDFPFADMTAENTARKFAAEPRHCTAVVSADHDASHLANAMGLPVVGLSSARDAARTPLVFRAPGTLLTPPGPGAPLSAIAPAAVLQAAARYLWPEP